MFDFKVVIFGIFFCVFSGYAELREETHAITLETHSHIHSHDITPRRFMVGSKTHKNCKRKFEAVGSSML